MLLYSFKWSENVLEVWPKLKLWVECSAFVTDKIIASHFIIINLLQLFSRFFFSFQSRALEFIWRWGLGKWDLITSMLTSSMWVNLKATQSFKNKVSSIFYRKERRKTVFLNYWHFVAIGLLIGLLPAQSLHSNTSPSPWHVWRLLADGLGTRVCCCSDADERGGGREGNKKSGPGTS